MPSWASTYKKHQSEGFEIIAIECQGSSSADIAAFMKGKNAEFEATTGGQLKGSNVSGIPHGFLFGPDGKLISDTVRGGAGLEKEVAKAVKECGAMMAGPGPYVKLAPLAAQVKAGVGLGTVLKTLTTKKNSKDAAEAAEATMMYDAMQANVKEQIENAEEKKSEDVVATVSKYDRLAMQFAGDDIGKKAKEEADKLKKDPQVKKEIEGAGMWKMIEAYNDKLKPVKGLKDPKDPVFVKINVAELQVLVGGCRTIIARCPNTAAAKKAQEYIDQYVKT